MGIVLEKKAGELEIKVFDSRMSMGEAAASETKARIKELLGMSPEINMIFAAAPSQNEFLAALITDKSISWDRINAFHMDEYIGLEQSASQRFGIFLKERLFDKVKFKSVNYIDGNTNDLEAECQRYARLLNEYPADIVCMGIGENGHIAFNDPHEALFDDEKSVKIVKLDEKCRKQQVNDGCFSRLEEVPTHAITLTIPALMRGRYICCVVPAQSKAKAVFNTVYGDIAPSCPASILKTHSNARLYADIDSASLILAGQPN